jgi:Tfp pilus assembly protein PilF
LTHRRELRLTSKSMRTPLHYLISPLSLLAFIALSGCIQDQIDANNRQLAAQQAQLDQLKQQVMVLQNRSGQGLYTTPPIAPNACDTDVMKDATRKGGERMAAGNPAEAVGYYQDAVTACPGSAEAQLNLAHAYEITGDNSAARQHYRLAAAASGPNADPAVAAKARDAIMRIGP